MTDSPGGGPATWMNVDQAAISRQQGGRVVICDPACPLLVTVTVTADHGRLHLSEITVSTRTPQARITAAVLGRLPVPHLVHVAACAAGVSAGHPNEQYYRSLARPKPAGQRGWDAGHWDRVLAVYEWARATGRPGGGVRAVADLWAVAVNPTAARWLAQARQRRAGQPRAE